MQTTVYYADKYLRLSVADGDKIESDSINNQRELLNHFLETHPEIKFHKERVDDGYSGVDFNRPQFQEMMEDIRAGKVNCVIVKDLSRFGRNHIEMGKYLQQIFPFMGVRFIAINDNYDSLYSDPSTDNLIIPIKNLMNDSYCSDTSMKIRSYLDVARKNGKCVNSFAVYGYKKDPDDKHHLIVDEPAAIIVQDIFNKKLEGMSLLAIADQLNFEGVPSPLEYKKMCGEKLYCGFQSKNRALWTAKAVGRIIHNAVYIGRLEQGKRVRPNYKIKKSILRDESEWICVENAHQAIISEKDFNIANDLILSDTRIAPGAEKTYIFSGLVFCGDCKQGMVHRVVDSGGKKYDYYICSTYRLDTKACSMHNISEKALFKIVETAVKNEIQAVLKLKEMLDYISTLPRKSFEAIKLDQQLVELNKELKHNEHFKTSAFEKYIDGTISEDMHREYTAIYDKKCSEIRSAIEKRQQAINEIMENQTPKTEWIDYFIENRNIEHLDRLLLVRMVKRIYIHSTKRIEIVFHHETDFKSAMEYILYAQKMTDFDGTQPLKEVG